DFEDWTWPEYEWPEIPDGDGGTVWDLPDGGPGSGGSFVCSTQYCPDFVDCLECFTWNFNTKSIVKLVYLEGPYSSYSLHSILGGALEVCVLANTEDGAAISIGVVFREKVGTTWIESEICEKTVHIECCPVDEITMHSSSPTIDRGDTIQLWIDDQSDFPYGPYTWEIYYPATGTSSYLLSQTESVNLEQIDLDSANTACECAKIIVTNDCGNQLYGCIIMDDVNDTFTGDDGALADICLWSNKSDAVIQSNKIRFHGDDDDLLGAEYRLSGDFNFSISSNVVSQPPEVDLGTKQWYFAFAAIEDGTGDYLLFRYGSAWNDGVGEYRYCKQINKKIGGVVTSITTSWGGWSGGGLTASRVDNTLTVSGGGLSESITDITSNVRPWFRCDGYGADASGAIVDFDNFSRTAGYVIWPNCTDCVGWPPPP
ncbi:MAG: hypothetical protein SWO11_22535, partial [Thermodesulfobacteriota bacterium]|nr:hypothetical protein [Thermodesulfobacteriota bacterium]